MNLYMVELAVNDWPAAVAWYRDVLGLKVLMRVEEDRFALLQNVAQDVAQAGETRLALKQAPEPGGQPVAQTPRGQGVLLTFEVPDLPAAVALLRERGVSPETPIQSTHEGYRRALFRDPDGYRLCLFDWGTKA